MATSTKLTQGEWKKNGNLRKTRKWSRNWLKTSWVCVWKRKYISVIKVRIKFGSHQLEDVYHDDMCLVI